MVYGFGEPGVKEMVKAVRCREAAQITPESWSVWGRIGWCSMRAAWHQLALTEAVTSPSMAQRGLADWEVQLQYLCAKQGTWC